MRFSLRIFLGFFLLVLAIGWYGLAVVKDEIKPAVRQATEEALVDTANVLAAMVGNDFAAGRLSQSQLATAMAQVTTRRPGAKVWGVDKNAVQFRVYITDQKGIVQFDSSGTDVGKDYSQWRDVARTLRGEYGVRTTRSNPADPLSSVMYVAAPIFSVHDANQIVGALTVVKSNSQLQPYINRIQDRLATLGWSLLTACLALGAVFSWGLSRGISRLTEFARQVSQGERVATPKFWANRELSTLAHGLDDMRRQLDGRAHTEHTVQVFTHELKSPLTGIRGAAELLQEPMATPDVQHFASLIVQEAHRMQMIVDHLLELARIEALPPFRHEPIMVREVVMPLIDALQLQVGDRTMTVSISEGLQVRADPLLLASAVRNLLQNALDATPAGGRISIEAHVIANGSDKATSRSAVITIANTGDPIPDYALERVFERFYSLPSPYRKGKGSGLGLAVVQAIATLHRGQVSLTNGPNGMVVAAITLPL
jgi:two-component system sensor histidine kinase CreC